MSITERVTAYTALQEYQPVYKMMDQAIATRHYPALILFRTLNHSNHQYMKRFEANRTLLDQPEWQARMKQIDLLVDEMLAKRNT